MSGITGGHTLHNMILGLITMLAAVICTVYTVYQLIFNRQYLVDLWAQNGLFANSLFVFASIFAFFITLIFIYGVVQAIKSKVVQIINRREDDAE